MLKTGAPHRIAVLAAEGFSSFHLSVPCIVFADDQAQGDAPRYALVVCAETPGLVSTGGGFSIEVKYGLSALASADTVIVPAWSNPDIRPSESVLIALKAAHRRGARIVGLCLGAFVLAEAGLLDGRPASTHWAWADDFSRRYPNVKLNRDVLFVDDGDVFTSAGTAAAIDCCLHLLRLDYGAEIANQTARRMVVAPHRSGGQSQYIEQPVPAAISDDRLARTLEWAIGHLAEPLTIDTMADRAAMSRRNFSRRFRTATGATFIKWLLMQRLTLAQRLLETTDRNMDAVAEQTGFGSPVTFRQHFSATFAISPAAYRRQFRHTGAASLIHGQGA